MLDTFTPFKSHTLNNICQAYIFSKELSVPFLSTAALFATICEKYRRLDKQPLRLLSEVTWRSLRVLNFWWKGKGGGQICSKNLPNFTVWSVLGVKKPCQGASNSGRRDVIWVWRDWTSWLDAASSFRTLCKAWTIARTSTIKCPMARYLNWYPPRTWRPWRLVDSKIYFGHTLHLSINQFLHVYI